MMKTQYIKPEIQMVLLEKKLMASNSISWIVDNSNKENDPNGENRGPIYGYGPYGDWGTNFEKDPFNSDNW